MILTDKKIIEEIEKGTIKIEPYNPDYLGSNSYDCTLGKVLAVYLNGLTLEVFQIIAGLRPYCSKTMREYHEQCRKNPLDAAAPNPIVYFPIPENGITLYDQVFYLGASAEYTETHAHVPFIEGKSSTGRLSIDIHATAGKGDVGFCGYWTLEISVKQPVRVYKGMPIGQLIYFPVDGEVETKYDAKKNAKYAGQGHLPKESMMWKNKFFENIRPLMSDKKLSPAQETVLAYSRQEFSECYN